MSTQTAERAPATNGQQPTHEQDDPVLLALKNPVPSGRPWKALVRSEIVHTAAELNRLAATAHGTNGDAPEPFEQEARDPPPRGLPDTREARPQASADARGRHRCLVQQRALGGIGPPAPDELRRAARASSRARWQGTPDLARGPAARGHREARIARRVGCHVPLRVRERATDPVRDLGSSIHPAPSLPEQPDRSGRPRRRGGGHARVHRLLGAPLVAAVLQVPYGRIRRSSLSDQPANCQRPPSIEWKQCQRLDDARRNTQLRRRAHRRAPRRRRGRPVGRAGRQAAPAGAGDALQPADVDLPLQASRRCVDGTRGVDPRRRRDRARPVGARHPGPDPRLRALVRSRTSKSSRATSTTGRAMF